MFGGDERTHLHAFFFLCAHLDAARRGGQVGDQLVVDLRARVDAAGRGAILAGVVETEGAHAADHGFQVRVVEHDDRRLAAELEMRALGAIDRGARAPSRRWRSTPVSEIIATSGCDTSGAPTVLPRPQMMFTTPGGNSSAQMVAELERGERRLLGGLEHHGVAGGQRRAQLPGGHHQWIVPRRDGGDHADGIAADHAGEARQVFTGHRAVHGAARAGEEAEHIGDGRNLVVERGRQRFAAVLRFERGEVRRLRPRCDRRVSAAGWRDPSAPWRPSRQRPSAAASTAALTCSFVGLGHLRDDLAGGRIEHVLLVPLALDQLAVNEQFRVHRRAS